MTTSHWCRSKYWLCHFLNTRHLRPKIITPSQPINNNPLYYFLQKQNALPLFQSPWPINQAIHQHDQDPAFIQTIRLLAKKKTYLQTLRINIINTLTPPHTPYTPTHIRNIHSRFSLKFALSIDLIDQVIALTLYQSQAQAPNHATYAQLTKDTNNHITFYTEYLTYAYANFNFVRRNLRRLRLRAMFITALYQTQKIYTPLLPESFKQDAWLIFESAIKTMLPYRRTTLTQNLRHQEKNPFATPQSIIK